jgi:histone-arginine methyltransferase CARM1
VVDGHGCFIPVCQVYAIEASPIAKWAAQLCKQNPVSANVVEVVEGMVEVVDIPEQADILISEPMGTLLVSGSE